TTSITTNYTLSLHDALPIFSGSTDFSNASRPIKDEEKKKLDDKGIKYDEFKVAQDGVTITVNKENDFVDELTKEQLREIYSGKRSEEHTSELQSRFDLVCRL